MMSSHEYNDYYIAPNPTGPTEAVSIDDDVCIGCNSCVNICRMQTILPNPEPGKPPVLAYPDECWYCGCCVEVCRTGALKMNLPINQRVFFKRKCTGETFRIGQLNSPEKSYFVPPYGYRR
jgi:NAD-dependent dihydropyrimidine dehydrogenase PreA subunit